VFLLPSFICLKGALAGGGRGRVLGKNENARGDAVQAVDAVETRNRIARIRSLALQLRSECVENSELTSISVVMIVVWMIVMVRNSGGFVNDQKAFRFQKDRNAWFWRW